ncbi:hypothetical protein Btru_060675, partial [Bulinus truncatus]
MSQVHTYFRHFFLLSPRQALSVIGSAQTDQAPVGLAVSGDAESHRFPEPFKSFDRIWPHPRPTEAPYFDTQVREEIRDLIGEKVILPCKAFGTPRPYHVWYRNNTLIRSHGDPRFILKPNSLEILNARREDSGRYSCHVSNQYGEQWLNLTLVIRNQTEMDQYLTNRDQVGIKTPRPVDKRPKDQKHIIRWGEKMQQIRSKQGTATSFIFLECVARGSPEPTITWYKDNKILNASERFSSQFGQTCLVASYETMRNPPPPGTVRDLKRISQCLKKSDRRTFWQRHL